MKSWMKVILMTVPIMQTMTAMAHPALIPQPTSVTWGEGAFVLTADTPVWADADSTAVGHILAESLAPATGWRFAVAQPAGNIRRGIALGLDAALTDLGREGYTLTVMPRKIVIQAAHEAGLFYGIQTLRQLLPAAIYRAARVEGVTWSVPCVEIKDVPRFSWRGLHLDVARHFMPKEFVKKYIDLLALHKLNILHLHLTDDQGWRIEIKRYPKLTEVGAWRKETLIGHAGKRPFTFDGKRHGGFYTQDDVREIVAYAGARFVTVVPEIEMPGHSQAAIAAYPELGVTDKPLEVLTTWGVCPNILNADESTVRFCQNVLNEVMDLFDSPFVHVGGDEATKTQWEQSPAIQARIKSLGLKDEHALQSWFIRRMDKFLTDKGRRLIGWDEILEGGLAPGATVMSWRGEAGGIAAAQAGHDVVMTPTGFTYLDYYQADPKQEPLAIGGFLDVEKVYSYNPVPSVLTAEQAGHILGVQAQLWTEYLPTPKQVEYMAFPRGCALAEVAWTPVDQKDYAQFKARLAEHVKRLAILDVNFRALDQ